MSNPNLELPPLPSTEAITDFHPVYSVPSPVEVVGNVRLPEPTLTGLPPEMRQRIEAKLATVTPGNRDLFERQFIREELEANSINLRVQAGAGEGADPFQRATLELANNIRLVKAEIAASEAALEEVASYENAINSETGKPEAVPVHALRGDARLARQAELQRARHRLNLLEGHEGQKQLQAALEETRRAAEEQREELAILHEAKELAAKQARTERVEKLAAAFAKSARANLG